MPVIEYKLIKSKNGNEVPPFVKNGGNWQNPADFSMVGWLDPEPRKYWVPDTIVELTKEQFATRLLTMHAATPFQDPEAAENIGTYDSDGAVPLMTDAEVRTMAEAWYDNFVEGYS